eukprot:gene25720-33586_t
MKDIPDVHGDKIFNIISFSVKFGQQAMFRFASNLLVGLLSLTGFGIITQVFSKLITSYQAISRLVIGSSLLGISYNIYNKSNTIDVKQENIVFDYYMYIWKIFYICYILLPFIK